MPPRPRRYVCHRVVGPISLTGRGDDPAWRGVPWTEEFVDIEGAGRPAPPLRTRVKMCHDRTHFHVLAEMAEPHVHAAITARNSVIFHENDFELFLDPDGDGLNYHEIELNALNTVWELTLPAPYHTGAAPTDPDNLPGLRSAVFIDGTLNDPSDLDRGWSCAVSIPFADLQRFGGSPDGGPPADGATWRVNFSRVEWAYAVENGTYVKSPADQSESNWVWSPQGMIDMHRPERWGRVRFTDQPPPPARDRLMAVSEAMRERPADPTDNLNLPASDVL